MKTTYWIVVGNAPSSRPFRHQSLSSASSEAKRLAREPRGIAFTVFEAVEVSEAVDIKTETFDRPPF
jgi:hypothetical protein